MSKVDLVVLGFLKRKPEYGYEIIQLIKKHHIDVWADIKLTTVYKVLQRLQLKKLISGKLEYDPKNPPKTVFSINEKGSDYLKKLLSDILLNDSTTDRDFWLSMLFIKKNISKELFVEALTKRE